MIAQLKTQQEQLVAQSQYIARRDAYCNVLEAERLQLSRTLDTTSQSLLNTTENLNEVTKHFLDTKAELRTTMVRLKASNAVVVEQSTTETTLLKQGKTLQHDLGNHTYVHTYTHPHSHSHTHTHTLTHYIQHDLGSRQDILYTLYTLYHTKPHYTTLYHTIQTIHTIYTIPHYTHFIQHDLGNRQDDVQKLLGKVDRMVAMEDAHTIDALSYVHDASNATNDLMEKVDEFRAQCRGHSVSLSHDVDSIVAKAKDSCCVLSDSLDKSLYSLHNSIQTTTDLAGGSCEALKDELNCMRTAVEEIVRGLQGMLSTWVVDVEADLIKAQQTMKTHQHQSDALTSDMHLHSNTLNTLNTSFVSAQQTLRDDITVCAWNLRNDMKERFDAHTESARQHAEETTMLLKSKTEEIKKVVMMVVRQMQEKAAVIADAQVASAAVTYSHAIQDMEREVARMSSKHHTFIQKSQAEIDAAMTGNEMSNDACRAAIHELHTTNIKVSGVLQDTRAQVDQNCMTLDEVVESSSKHIQQAMQTSRTTFETTSYILDTMVPTVQHASEGVQRAVAESQSRIVQFTEAQVAAISNQVNRQSVVSSRCTEKQIQGLDTSTNRAVVYHQGLQANTLVPTGLTPSKMPLQAHIVLSKTREHALIKHDALEALVEQVGTIVGDENTPCNLPNVPPTVYAESGSIARSMSLETIETMSTVSQYSMSSRTMKNQNQSNVEKERQNLSPPKSPIHATVPPIFPRSPNRCGRVAVLGEKISRSPFHQRADKQSHKAPMKFA